MSLRSSRHAAAFAAVLLALPAWAASDWQPVAAANGDRVEIDKGRIMRTAPGTTVAWTRLIFAREMKDGAGSYTAVQAMNRYDCAGHSFATVRRVYMQGAKAVREESVSSPREMSAAAGSLDDKLLTAACRPRSVDEAQQVAEAVARAMPVQPDAKPSVMYADMRSGGDKPTANTLTVADKPEAKAEAKPEAKPEAKSESKAETKPEAKPAAERPRFIELPKIDKSQLEDPNQPPPAKAAPGKPGETTPAAAKAAAKAAEKAAVAAKPAEPVAPAASRQQLERQYATSGPRKAAPAVVHRRPVEPPEPVVAEHRHIHWSYEGEGGPVNWAKLRPDYATCATGKRQSPIDIRDSIRVDQEPIAFDYKPSQFRIVDNGHTVQASVGEGSSITIMGRTYQLVQLHFHRPAEERINGRSFDMVIHLVHKDDQDHLAVVAVLLEKGAEHPVIQTLWNNLPLEVDQELAPAAAIDISRLLPEIRTYYAYMGSLTTPPCTEGVLWLVMKEPVQVSAEQMAIFARLYRNNARPVQQANGRLIKESR